MKSCFRVHFSKYDCFIPIVRPLMDRRTANLVNILEALMEANCNAVHSAAATTLLHATKTAVICGEGRNDIQDKRLKPQNTVPAHPPTRGGTYLRNK